MAQVRLLLVLERTFLGFTQGLCLVGMLRDVQGPRRATRLAAVDLRPSTGGGRLAAVDWRRSTFYPPPRGTPASTSDEPVSR